MQAIEARIRHMNPSDASQVFALRRRAILQEPLAFLASTEDDVARSVEAVRSLLDRAPDSVVFGAESAALVGMLGVFREIERLQRGSFNGPWRAVAAGIVADRVIN